MSIYVLRSDNLVKIGFTDNLRKRVREIIGAVPVPVEFVGHMPGDRDVEAHLHERFAATRFSGEWFVETPAMRAVFDTILTPQMPAPQSKAKERRRIASGAELGGITEILRDLAANQWPKCTHAQRIDALTEELGWTRNRVKDLYYSDSRVAVRSVEREELDTLIHTMGTLSENVR